MKRLKELLEKSGAGDWGTDELTQTLRKGTPGQGITDIGVKNKERKESIELDEGTDFRAGDTVYQVGSKLKGTVLHKGNQDKIVVKFGSINKMIPANQLRLAEEVDLDEEKVIKIVADTNTRKYKEGEVIKTFPETKAGLTRAMAHQVTLKNKHGVPTTVVRESVELDEAKGTGVKKFVKNMRVAKLHNPDMKGTVVKGGDNLKKGVEVEWDSGKTTVTSGKYLMSIKKNESVELDELDSKTYRSYHDKATADQLKRAAKNKRSKEDQRIMLKRSLGIATAGMKQYGDKRTLSQRIRGEEVELDEGAVAVSTVEKEIRKNGGTRVKKSDHEITFTYKGSERKIPVDRGFVTSDHYMKIQDMMEDLQERPFGGDSVLKDLMPGAYNFLDKTINNRRYQFAIRMFLDLRKKNPNDARNNLIKAAKIADVDVRVLDRLFRNMIKKGAMPKHLMNYYPTFVEDITEKLKVSDGLGAWIKDFQDSDAPQFKDADSKKRRDMAIAAFTAAGGKLGEELEEGSESWEAGYKRRVVKTTKPEHKEKGYNWRIKGKDRPEISIKLYKEKPSFDEFKKQMKRVAGHEFGG